MRPILADVRLAANYVFHLAAVAKVGFDSEYSQRYLHTVIESDRNFLIEHRHLLSFGSGSGSELVGVFLFLPSYLDFACAEEFSEYFRLLDAGCESGEFSRLFQHYSDRFEKLSSWISRRDYETELGAASNHRETVAKLGRLVLRNFSAYVSSVWPIERPKLLSVANAVSEHFAGRDPISEWERITGIRYELNSFHASFVSAIGGGPNANSLSYDTVIFHHERPFDYTVQLIQHEVGTHILFQTMRRLADSERYDWPVLYAAYECLAKFYNRILLGKNELAYQLPKFHQEEFLAIYEKLTEQSAEIGSEMLLRSGIEMYLKRRTTDAS